MANPLHHAAAFALLCLAAPLTGPLAAQGIGPADSATDDLAPQTVTEPVQTAFVYGDDAAPPCPEGTICVIARLPDGDRYRIPETLRFSENPENQSWASRVEKLELVGGFGALSCSPVGAGGFTGCTQQLVDAAFADKRNGEAVRFSQLIAAAREERLSTIDADAAAEQERVEQIERAYLERLERERSGVLPGEEGGEEGREEEGPEEVGALPQPGPEPVGPALGSAEQTPG
jgi:hypothetical protein